MNDDTSQASPETQEYPADGVAVVPLADTDDIPPSQRGIRRRRLLPAWVVVTLAALLAVAVGASFGVPAILASARVEVPDVAGLTVQAATDKLELAGFEVERGDERFSADVPKGAVIEQSPAPGTRVAKGSTVVLVTSAGTESFQMPDVVGRSLEQARQVLAARGLAIRIDVVPSEAASGTVISTIPAPGARVTTSDVVRVSVAGKGEASSALLPFRLDGISMALDPAPVATGTVDVPMEVARRLRALLEASGARVVVTRAAVNPSPTNKQRADAAKDATAAVVIGLDVATTGDGGLSISTAPNSTERSAFGTPERDLAARIAAELRDGGRIVKVGTLDDPVFRRVLAPGVRVHLGSTASREDATAYTDPRWADEIARALYRALGEEYGKK